MASTLLTAAGCRPAKRSVESATISPKEAQSGNLQISPANAKILPTGLQDFSIQGGVPPYHLEIYSGGGSIDPSTGRFQAPASGGVSILRAQDTAGAIVYATVSSTAAPSISPASLVLAQGNTFPFSVSGGAGPYTFSIHSGTATIQLTTGQFNATAVGSITVRVTDSTGKFSDSSVTVNAPLALSPKTMTATIRNTRAFTSHGGVPPYRYKVISGSGNIDSNGAYLAPYIPGTDIIEVKDSFGNSDIGVVSINSDLSLGPSSSVIAQGTSMLMTASGGIPPYSYSTEGGNINSSGVFTAPPSSSSGPSFITVTDSAGNTALASVSVVPGVSFSVQNLTLPVNGVFDFATVTNGGVGSKTFVAATSQGSFTGSVYTAPSSPGVYFVNVYDSQWPSSNSASAQITVNPALRLTPSSTDLAPSNSENFSVSGGVPPYTFSIQSGSGSIAPDGTYTAGSGSGSAVVRVLDSYGTSVTSSVTIEAALQITPASKVMNTASTFQFNSSGGVGQKTYTLVSGTGSIHPVTGVYSAPSSAGSSTIRVTDERGNTRQASITLVSPLQLLPSQVPILVGTTFPLVGSGGAAPYTYTLTSGQGSVDAQGVFTAPAAAGSSTVEIRDTIGNTQTAAITVYSGLLLMPFGKTLIVNQTLSFQASGGVTPYTYQVTGGGAIDSSTGLYTAAGIPGSAVVQVTDALGKVSQVSVTIQPLLSLSPTSATLGILNPTRFSASGGIPPYVYQLSSGSGILNSSTGDYRAPSSSGSAQIQVTDSDGTTASASVTIQPALVLTSSLVDLAPNSTATLSATGGVSPYTLNLASGNGNLNSSTGVYSAPNIAGSAVVRVVDSLGNSGEVTLQTYSALSLSPSSRLIAVQNQALFTPSGGKLPYTFSVSPAGGAISNGGIYTAPTGTGNAVVQVTDALGQSSQATVTISEKVSISPSQITLAPSGTQIFTASGGVGPYTFVRFSGAGNLSDTTYTGPATGGTVAIIRVTDSYGDTADAVVTVTDQAPTSLSYLSSSATYTKGTPISSNTPSSTGGSVITYAISPPLPAGLNFNTLTGIISGTPTAISASSSYTVTASNSGGSVTATLNLTVNDIAPSNLAYSSASPTYTNTILISPNTPTALGGAITGYSVSPNLPSGLTLGTSTGIISGTPGAISTASDYTVTATNSGGSTTATVRITVNDLVPSFSYASLSASYTKDTTISSNNPTSTGGAITGYSVSPSLPAGLALSTTTGIISGKPTAIAATSNYTVTASNSGGSATVVLSITVNDVAPSSLTYASPSPVYTKDTAISPNNPSALGGPVTAYSVSPALPAGLSLNTTTGIISGTPTIVTAAASYTITASNSGGSTTKVLSITVNDIAPSGLSYSSNPSIYSTGVAISPNSPLSLGGPVISYSVSPSLPSGLTLSTSSGIITGNPAGPASLPGSYTVTATNSGGSTTASLSIAIAGPLTKTAPTLSLKTPSASLAKLTTPTVTAAGVEPGSNVKIYVNNSACTGAYAANGDASSTTVDITLPALSSDGPYEFYSKFTDLAGHDSPCSLTALSYTLDTQYNTITIALSIPASSPSTIPTPTVIVSPIEANSTVNIYKNVSCTGAPFATGTSETLTLPDLGSDGDYKLYASYTDFAKNTSNCPQVLYTLDRTAPVLPSPNPSPSFTANTYNSFTMNWSPATDLTTVTYRAYYAKDSSLITQVYDSTDMDPVVAGVTASPGWSTSTSWSVSGLTQGTTYFTGLIARDAVGNKSKYGKSATYTIPIQSTSTLPVLYYDAAFRNKSYGASPCTSGTPVAWTDLSGAGNNGGFPVGYTCTANSGWRGSGTSSDPYRVTLDGTTGTTGAHIETPVAADPTSMPNSTWEAWVYPTTMLGRRQQIMSSDGPSFGRSLLIETNTIGLYFFTGSVSPYVVWAATATMSGWQHMAISFDSSYNIKVYQNGVLAKSFTAGGQLSTKKLWVGDNPAGGGEAFIGSLGMVTVFDKVLTVSEILGHCRNQKIRFDNSLCP